VIVGRKHVYIKITPKNQIHIRVPVLQEGKASNLYQEGRTERNI